MGITLTPGVCYANSPEPCASPGPTWLREGLLGLTLPGGGCRLGDLRLPQSLAIQTTLQAINPLEKIKLFLH